MNKRTALTVRETVIFSMLGAIMFTSKILMEGLPNIHLVGMLTMTYTLVYRKKALIPIYVFVMLNGLYTGFSVWCIPYLYVWTVLWAATMLIPQKISKNATRVLCCIICGLHGLLFGVLYAPVQALLFGMNFKATLAWIAAGLSFDIIHAVGNLVVGILILPLADLIGRLDSRTHVH